MSNDFLPFKASRQPKKQGVLKSAEWTVSELPLKLEVRDIGESRAALGALIVAKINATSPEMAEQIQEAENAILGRGYTPEGRDVNEQGFHEYDIAALAGPLAVQKIVEFAAEQISNPSHAIDASTTRAMVDRELREQQAAAFEPAYASAA